METKEDQGKSETISQKVRINLGIPRSLDNKPVLYLSSHRGLLDGRYSSHVAIFKKTLKGEDEEDIDKEYAYIDLSESTSDQVANLLREILLREESKKHTSAKSNKLNNDPLPEFISNVVYLPKLDENGRAVEETTTFSLDQYAYKKTLPKLKKFLVEKGILDEGLE